MSDNHQRHPNPAGQPYKRLGQRLKTMRQRLQESLGETSGAVEIDVEQLDRIERGAELPGEDILMLLISHFGLADDEAVRVWELAGYDTAGRYGDEAESTNGPLSGLPLHSRNGQMPVMLLALDQRVLYTNTADIHTDDAGVVINFAQDEPAGTKRYVVGRMGMSYSQAEQLMHSLQRMLLHRKYLSGPKQLPSQASE